VAVAPVRQLVRVAEVLAVAVALLLHTLLGAAGAAHPEIHVRGNQLVDGGGQHVRLVGVNRSGTEYMCVVGGTTGAGIFSGPSGPASVSAIKAWHANAVRVSLNEDCWLGINGVNPRYSGERYRNAILDYVDALNGAGIVAILDLHWNAPGATLSTGQQVMADADHAPAFWTSVATAFTGNPGVMFDLYNEPRDISWSCWQLGCTTADGWTTVGMQDLIDVVRRTGATQPIIATGLDHGNDLSGWRSYALHDPRHQLVAGVHVYNTDADGYCSTAHCWTRMIAPVAAKVPVVTAELGEHDQRSTFVESYLAWADRQWRAHRSVSSVAWAWDAAQGKGGPSLIESFAGQPSVYGSGFRDYLAKLEERGAIHQW
jgi:hypothetical protein